MTTAAEYEAAALARTSVVGLTEYEYRRRKCALQGHRVIVWAQAHRYLCSRCGLTCRDLVLWGEP